LKNNDNFVNHAQNGVNEINSLQKLCKPKPAQIIAELIRAKVAFQLATICAILKEQSK
jgi:hypothetical protein